jgi:hypothetical protein
VNCPELAHSLVHGRLVLAVLNGMVLLTRSYIAWLTATNSYKKYFDVSLTVHHIIDLSQ